MGFVGLKTNTEEEAQIEELETLLRSMDPLQRIDNRSAAIKEGIRIALFHLKGSYIYQWSLTAPIKGQTSMTESRPIERISSNDIDLDGKRKPKPTPPL